MKTISELLYENTIRLMNDQIEACGHPHENKPITQEDATAAKIYIQGVYDAVIPFIEDKDTHDRLQKYAKDAQTKCQDKYYSDRERRMKQVEADFKARAEQGCYII